MDRGKQRRILTKRRCTPHDGSQIKTKTIYMAGFNPIAQAFTCVFHNARMAQIEGVPTTGPVVVITIVPDPIIATVINSAQREDRPFEIQLGAVVQNDIENDLNPRFVQRFYRVAKLIKRTLRRSGLCLLAGECA